MIDLGIDGLNVISNSFKNGEVIPKKFTKEGENINPSIIINNLPLETESIVIILDNDQNFTHWIVYNIDPTTEIKENENPGIEAMNDFNKRKYIGPVSSKNKILYFFRVYALNKLLDISNLGKRKEIENAMGKSIISRGELMCIYGGEI